MANRTYELYGFVKGDPNLVKAGLRVRIYDRNFVERTDPSETFLTRSTTAGIVYRVRADGDRLYDTPTDTHTGLRDLEKFYITFEKIGIDLYGWPARTELGDLLTVEFTSGPSNLKKLDVYLSFFQFSVKPSSGAFVNRPTISVDTEEPDSRFLITTGGQEPILGGAGVTEITGSQTFLVNDDGVIELRISGVDRFSNVNISQTYVYTIENPTVKILEAITLREIKIKRYFYQEAFTITSNVYTRIGTGDLDILIAEASESELDDLYYVPLEPGVVENRIFGPRYARLASNRAGTISYRVTVNDATPGAFSTYVGQLITLDQVVTQVEATVVDQYLGTSELLNKTYKVIPYGPIIEQVTINEGDSLVSNRNIIVNVLVKGPTPQMITIGQNPLLFPNEFSSTGDPEDLQGTPAYGYGYGYLKFCLDSPPCDNIVHTAFNERTPFQLADRQGEQCIFIRVRDFDNNGFPLVRACINVNTVLPFVTFDTPPTSLLQTSQYYTFTGSKLPGSNIMLNGEIVVEADDTTTWFYEVRLSPGSNTFTFTSQDNLGRISTAASATIEYTFVFTGITEAVLRANADGTWEAPLMGLRSSDPNNLGRVFDIVAESTDDYGNIASTTRTVLVTEKPLQVQITSPSIYTPVNECEQSVFFSVVNLEPLDFLGPYSVLADADGNWEIDGIAVDPAEFTDSTEPNQEIVVVAHNQDGEEYTTSVSIHVRGIEKVFVELDQQLIGTDLEPPFDSLEGISLGELEDGKHTVRVTATDYLGFTSNDEISFNVDTTTPVVTITSPLDSEVVTTFESPILSYSVVSNSPLIRKTVYLDGVEIGAYESGSRLPELTDGVHTVVVEVESMARCELPIADGYGYGYGYGYGDQPIAYGKVGRDSVTFTYLQPIVVNLGTIDTVLLNIGNDINQEHQGEAVLEELRILNTPSSDADILADWRLLLNGIRFQNRTIAQITDEQRQLIAQQNLDSDRISLPKETLVLMHFDTSYQSLPGVDNRPKNEDGTVAQDANGDYITTENDLPLDLLVETRPIIDLDAATNQLAIDVFVKEDDPVDKDLIRESIDRIIPARGEALVVFETVSNEATQ